jgi:hypothetical protein
MKRQIAIVGLLMVCATNVFAQKNEGSIKVSPNGVNVNANGATTVFLTFGGLTGRRPAEAMWCGELMPAAPDIGFKCNPATTYGSLPDRFDLSTPSGRQALTDIMSIPASVARRAYQDAQAGAKSSFFYVRRFVSLSNGPDEYVFVTCRMAGSGASVPLALTSVKLAFADEQGVKYGKPGERLPQIKAEIVYNGTGRLVGRWEVVLPGDEPPTERDLLTEASLPVEERDRQSRYTQLSRFNVFLPPVSKYTLIGPDPSRLPTSIEGAYQILLRIEVSDDQDSGSNLAAIGAGQGFIQSGAVAGFPLPVLHYFVGSKSDSASATAPALTLLTPAESDIVRTVEPLTFSWQGVPKAAVYRLEVKQAGGQEVLSALLPTWAMSYRAPAWLKERGGSGELQWRVVAFGQNGEMLSASPWRSLKLVAGAMEKPADEPQRLDRG